MNQLLADTHAILWYLFDPTRLSAPATRALNGVLQADGMIVISTITLVEVRYLVEKGRLPPVVWTGLWPRVSDPATPVSALPVTEQVAAEVANVPRALVPDMPDRIIAATALAHGLPLVTKDAKIQYLTNVRTIW